MQRLDRSVEHWFHHGMRHTNPVLMLALIAMAASTMAATSEAPCSSFDGHWVIEGTATPSGEPARELDIQAGNIKRSDGTTSSMKACLLKDDGYTLVQDDTDYPLVMHAATPDIVEANDLHGRPIKYLRPPLVSR